MQSSLLIGFRNGSTVMRIKRLEVLAFIWLLLISLFSFYFYGIGVSLPPVIAASASVLAAPMIFRSGVLRAPRGVGWLFLFFAYTALMGLALSIGTNDVHLNRYLALPLFAAVVIASLYFVICKRHFFRSALRWVLIFHLFAFYVQVLSFYSGFGYIDYLVGVTGEAQRALGGNYQIDVFGGRLLRPTGLYNEPGTYATATMLLFLLYQRLGPLEESSISRADWVFFLSVFLSVILSFSVFGLIFIAIYALNSVRESKKQFALLFLIICAAAPFVYEYYIYPRFLSGAYADNGIGFRMEAFSAYLGIVLSDFPKLIFGFGFFSDLNYAFGFYAMNDMGLFFTILMHLGLVGLMIFIACLFGGSGLSKRALPLVIIFGLSKISMTSMLFWLIISTVTALNYSNRNALRR